MKTHSYNPAVLGGCVYYSQNREDLILRSFFPDVDEGVYVDVGAFDPDEDSVTKLFYEAGWHGVNIEPQPVQYKKFQKRRPRDSNVNVGIAQKEGELTLRVYSSGGLSTFSDNIKQNYTDQPDPDTLKYQDYKVPVRPLQTVLAQAATGKIHFMKVDVEGLEYDVLASNDWEKFRPEVLCIEANHVEKDWHPLLAKAGYELVFFDGLNEYFTDSRTDRRKKFNYVEDVVHARGGGIRADHFAYMYQLYERARDKSHHVDELVAYTTELEKSLRTLQAQRQRELRSLGFLVKRVAVVTARAVLRGR